MSHSKSVIIVAGGSGKRMGADIPKQFLLLKNKPVLFYSLEAFYAFDPNIQIVLVLPKSHMNYWEDLCTSHDFKIPHDLTEGGETRFYSVKNGLSKIQDSDFVAIHDGARPMIDTDTIRNLFDQAEKNGNAVPFVPVNESTRLIQGDGSKIIDRSKLCIIQTPQIFKTESLKSAYKQDFNESFTDDASVIEENDEKIYLAEGHWQNIKITRSIDLKVAEAFLENLS